MLVVKSKQNYKFAALGLFGLNRCASACCLDSVRTIQEGPAHICHRHQLEPEGHGFSSLGECKCGYWYPLSCWLTCAIHRTIHICY